MRTLIVVVAISLCVACTATLGPSDAVEIRIANESPSDFDDVLVVFPGQAERYPWVPAHSVTGYRTIDSAYRYAYVEVHIGGDKLVLQPIDYFGESLLPPGRYTYSLDVDAQRTTLSLTLHVD